MVQLSFPGSSSMKSRLVQFSFVVVGQSHNPTILNPDFLLNQDIVPASWQWKVAETVTTPPLSLVRYENGVSITVEQDKIQLVDPNVESGPGESKVPEIAAAYVQKLPHVSYTAVGTNFQSLITKDEPGAYLIDRFLKPGPWNADATHKLNNVGIRFVYPFDTSGRFTLTIDAGAAKLPDRADLQQVLVANANFSRNCAPASMVKQAKEHLQKSQDDWVTYRDKLQSIFELDSPDVS